MTMMMIVMCVCVCDPHGIGSARCWGSVCVCGVLPEIQVVTRLVSTCSCVHVRVHVCDTSGGRRPAAIRGVFPCAGLRVMARGWALTMSCAMVISTQSFSPLFPQFPYSPKGGGIGILAVAFGITSRAVPPNSDKERLIPDRHGGPPG